MEIDLSGIPLISALDEETRTRSVVVRRYQDGEEIFHQGDRTTGLWFVIQGRVAVDRVGPDGSVTTTGVWIRGEIVGIAGLWDGSGYPATARALDTPTIMGWMDREVALTLHQRVPGFGLEMSRMLAERLRQVQELMANRQGRPVGEQLAMILLMLHRRLGGNIRLTHEDLAHMIGTHRETVSRALQELVKQGIITVRYGEIHVAREEKLRERAQLL